MTSERPHSLTPFERMCWQQINVRKDIIGYAVGLASDKTERAAYMLPVGERGDSWLTNNEKKAAILSKEEATNLMLTLREGDWYYRECCWKIAFLVPVSKEHPLTMCTFQGH